jgi:hypothetical protein
MLSGGGGLAGCVADVAAAMAAVCVGCHQQALRCARARDTLLPAIHACLLHTAPPQHPPLLPSLFLAPPYSPPCRPSCLTLL